ncbi:PAS domain S-box protein [Pseudalkalibacillus sp. SCS-8]|uniref:PAS domain S-box protein n=1 Tax=Pseudalkalibacillus nanhaiensis TaxID=3115291 RepID=UPI0032DA4828
MQKTSTTSYEMNQALLDQLSDGFIRTDYDGTILCANQTLMDWLGEGQAEELTINQLFPALRREKMIDGKPYNAELQRLDGTFKKVELSFFGGQGKVDYLVRQCSCEEAVTETDREKIAFPPIDNRHDFPIFLIDLDGTIRDVNDAAMQTLHSNRQALLGSTFMEFVEADQKQIDDCLRSIQEGDIKTFDVLMKASDGGVSEFLFTHLPLYIDCQLAGAYCIARNNSDLRRTQEALFESEQRYRQLVEHSPDPVCLHDSERIIYVNDVAAQLVGVKDKGDLIGRPIDEFIHSDDRNDSHLRIQKVKQGIRMEQLFPMKVVRPDGVVLEMEGKSIPIKENGNTYVLAVFRDVTEKNQAKRSLQRSERQYRSLFLHNPDGIYSINLKGELTSINPAIIRITGYTEAEQIGRHYSEFLLKEDQEQVIKKYESIFSGETIEFEKRMKRKNGDTIIVRVIGFPMIVENEIIGMYGILRDITDEKRSEELLRRSEKLTVVGELAAAVAHEIRNPLTSIKGFIQMLENGVPEKELYYQIVLSELDRIEQIISELLVLAKPQSICFQKKKIGNLITHVLKLLEGQANLHNIQFNMDLEAGSEMINCEENQLKQVFINLIKNAIEVMPNGGTITVTCKKAEKNNLLIRIVDEGPGIPKDRLSRLGEPFYTTKEKGTGLGLMVSFKIIKDHQGSMHFSSTVKKGTTVDVLLPLSQR